MSAKTIYFGRGLYPMPLQFDVVQSTVKISIETHDFEIRRNCTVPATVTVYT